MYVDFDVRKCATNCRYNSYAEFGMTYAYLILCISKLKIKILKWSPILYSNIPMWQRCTLYTQIHLFTT